MFRAVSVPAKIPNGTYRTHARKKTVKAKHLVIYCKALVSICRTGLIYRNVGHVSEYILYTHTHTHTALYDAKPKIMTYSQLPNTNIPSTIPH